VPFTAVASSRSAVMLDLDGDGDLDIVTNEMGDAPQVLISDLAASHAIHFLQVQLIGRKSNRDGLGALVRVTSAGRVWTQFHDGKSGHLGQSALPLYFGLGASGSVEKVEVDWPSGRHQVVTQDVGSNRLLKLTEPE
jgi:hypothetical protein